MLAVIKHAVNAFFSFSNTAHQRMMHTTQLSCSPKLWPQQPKAELK